MSDYTRVIMRAVYDLRGQEGARSTWPTAARIAAHLQLDEAEVRGALRQLKQERLFRDRRRGGETVWMPWAEIG